MLQRTRIEIKIREYILYITPFLQIINGSQKEKREAAAEFQSIYCNQQKKKTIYHNNKGRER